MPLKMFQMNGEQLKVERQEKLSKQDKTINYTTDQLEKYRKQAKHLEEELERRILSSQEQILLHQKEEHHNWLAAQIAEINLKGLRKENAKYRHKLTDTEIKFKCLHKDPSAVDVPNTGAKPYRNRRATREKQRVGGVLEQAERLPRGRETQVPSLSPSVSLMRDARADLQLRSACHSAPPLCGLPLVGAAERTSALLPLQSSSLRALPIPTDAHLKDRWAVLEVLGVLEQRQGKESQTIQAQGTAGTMALHEDSQCAPRDLDTAVWPQRSRRAKVLI
ncbi:Melanoma inhibitory activity protein 2 [Plecturocebus cupreus]